MNEIENKPLPPPPGVIDALRSGMDVIANHLGALFLPLTLDLALWLTSRLSMKNLFFDWYAKALDFYVTSGLFTSAQIDNVKNAEQPMKDFILKFNLISLLRSFPVGISSLMQSKMPVKSPFGSLTAIEIRSDWELAGWIFLLVIVGWVLGGLYFNSVSTLVEKRSENRLFPAVIQATLFNLGFTILILIVGMPVMLVLASLSYLNTFISQVAFFALAMVSSWFLVPIFFAPHGIFLRGQNVLASVVSSIRMSRFTLPTSSMFVLMVFLLGQGLNYLWSVPADDSWMLLVGVVGHAFITTSLLAASFIYYRDMNAWLAIALERMKTAATRQAL